MTGTKDGGLGLLRAGGETRIRLVGRHVTEEEIENSCLTSTDSERRRLLLLRSGEGTYSSSLSPSASSSELELGVGGRRYVREWADWVFAAERRRLVTQFCWSMSARLSGVIRFMNDSHSDFR